MRWLKREGLVMIWYRELSFGELVAKRKASLPVVVKGITLTSYGVMDH